jgi:two-component system, chemotaxis family, protein-glutamate methylesterase/glutaminase
MGRDIIVIGASAGGLTPLCTVLDQLPAAMPAAVFVVLHVGAESSLHEVLRKCARKDVVRPHDNQPIKTGTIYVAPPRVHLAVTPDTVQLVHGPRENRHRPAIDVLFRSASRHFGERVAGVILSGCLDDGAAGLLSVKARGGLAIVQDPADAAVPDMPAAALRLTDVDYSAPADKIAQILTDAMNGKTKKPGKGYGSVSGDGPSERSKELMPFVCPDCDGPIFQETTGKMTQLACSVGHRYSPESFSEAHRDALERALWIAIRTLENRKQIHGYLGDRAKSTGDMHKSTTMEETVAAAERDMVLIKEILQRL